MKAMLLPQTVKLCGMLIAISCLFSAPFSFAQPFYSALGPEVRITSPANHATFHAPADIAIFAYARLIGEPGAIFTNVEFFANGTNLGGGFNLGSAHPGLKPLYGNFFFVRPVPALGSVYCFVWTNAPAGSYALTAVAQAHDVLRPGLSRTSAPVNLTILASTTNANPTDVVSIVATDPVAVAGTNACWVWPGMTNALPAWTNWPPQHWQACTNWGPKNALFTVRRLGDASADLTVNYRIGGTASNGVDYATLTNFVTVPAGKACALVPVVPIDNGRTNFSRTVILTLTNDTNTPPDYFVGIPRSAAALILGNWPRPLPFLLADRCFHVNASGPDGAWFCVQSSSDLQNWSSVAANQVFQGSIDFVDPDAPDNSSRFYRALPVTNVPAD